MEKNYMFNVPMERFCYVTDKVSLPLTATSEKSSKQLRSDGLLSFKGGGRFRRSVTLFFCLRKTGWLCPFFSKIG